MKIVWSRESVTVRDVYEAMLESRKVAYTTVMTVLDRLEKRGGVSRRKQGRSFVYVPKLSREELRRFVARNVSRLRKAADKQRACVGAQKAGADRTGLAARLEETARRLEESLPLVEAPGTLDLEDLERRMTVLEEKLSAAISADADEETLLGIRREMDRSLAPYRRKMSAEQLAQLERRYVQKRLFERFEVPRLSLFYLT